MFEALLDSAVTLSDAELDDAVRLSEIALRRVQAEHSALVAVAEHRGLYRVDGHHTMSGYLRATTNASNAEVAKQRTIAEVCHRVPALGDALAAGRVGRSQIEQIGRIHTNPRTRRFFADVAPIYLERAEHLSHVDLRGEIDQFIQFADHDGAFAELAARLDHRTATVTDASGSLDVRVTGGDPITAARVVAIFEAFVQHELDIDLAARRVEHGDDADTHPLPRTPAQRRFDAAVKIFDSAAAAPAADGPSPVDVVVNIVIDQHTADAVFTRHGLLPDEIDTFDDEQLADTIDGLTTQATTDPVGWVDRRCHTAAGEPVHPDLALRAALTGHVRRVVVDSTGTIIDHGRRQRLFTGAARDAAKLLLRRCDHPGCLVASRSADVDHRHEWHDGGTTDQHNTGIQCSTHNRWKHRHRWRTDTDLHGHRFTIKPDGTIILPAGARPPTIPTPAQRIIRLHIDQLRPAA